METSTPEQPERLRRALVQALVARGAIASDPVRYSFEQVPRHLFVPRVDAETAYSDQPIFTRWDDGVPISSSTQPTMMAIMAEQLRLEPNSRVLEIGAATGYNAAILARIVGADGSVVTIDIDQNIVEEAAANLSQVGFDNVRCVCGDGFEGFAAGQPYDRIIATVGAYDVPLPWVDQLREGGIMVVPLWFKGFMLSVALQKREGELRSLSASPCMFIPIRGVGSRPEGYFSIGSPTDDSTQETIGLDSDDPDFRQDLRRLFDRQARMIPAGRSLAGHFHSRNIHSGLYMSLTIDPNSFAFFRPPSNGMFPGVGYGLVDRERMSAAVIWDTHPHQVAAHGTDAAYHRLLALLDRWDELGHPSVRSLSIRATPTVPHSIPENHWLIPKQSRYSWLLGWEN